MVITQALDFSALLYQFPSLPKPSDWRWISQHELRGALPPSKSPVWTCRTTGRTVGIENCPRHVILLLQRPIVYPDP